MIHRFTVTFGAKYLTGMVTSVLRYVTFRSRWSCDIQFHKYSVHINGNFLWLAPPSILSIGTTANSPLSNNHLLTSFCVSVACVSGLFILISPSNFSDDVFYCKKDFYSLTPIFVVSTKCIYPWVLEFVVANITATINEKIVLRWIFIFVV